MSDLLIRRDDTLSISVAPEAQALKLAALDDASFIVQVCDAHSQQCAVEAQQKLHDLLAAVEESRKAAKQPVLDFGRAIDAAAKQFGAELSAEQLRIGKLIGDFQALENARIEAARRAENERLSALDREKAAALAQAKSHDELEAVQETFNRRAADEAPSPETITPTRAEGQRVATDWEITVTDVWALARAHPACVTIEPRLSEIKALLKAGVKVPGVIGKEIVKAGVRRSKSTAINV